MDTATAIVGLIRGTIDPSTYVSVQRCEPYSYALIMLAIDQLLEAHGVTMDSTMLIHGKIVGGYRKMSWGDFVTF